VEERPPLVDFFLAHGQHLPRYLFSGTNLASLACADDKQDWNTFLDTQFFLSPSSLSSCRKTGFKVDGIQETIPCTLHFFHFFIEHLRDERRNGKNMELVWSLKSERPWRTFQGMHASMAATICLGEELHTSLCQYDFLLLEETTPIWTGGKGS
jgi:hypothetical protein